VLKIPADLLTDCGEDDHLRGLSVAVLEHAQREVAKVRSLADHAQAARDFLSDVRRCGGEAYRVRVGSRVDVVSGRRVPYGRYAVEWHGRRGGEVVLDVVGYEGRRFNRVSPGDVRVVPDFARQFLPWGSLGPILAGACQGGLSHDAVLILCDYVQEFGFGDCPWFVSNQPPGEDRVRELEPDEFVRQMRGLVAAATLPDGRRVNSFGLGPVLPSEAARTWNLYQS
jgi:hypothetical protein